MSKPILNQEFEVLIDNYTSEGQGVARVNNYPVFIPFSAVGDKLKIKIKKDKKTYFEGEIVEMLNQSTDRVVPSCEYFGQCGGCDLLHLSYEKQLEVKENTVKNAMKKIAKNENLVVNKVVGMDKPCNYRNKAVFNVDNINGEILVGFYKKKSNEIINMKKCNIIHNKIDEIRLLVQEFCNENKFLPKKLAVKYSFSKDELMICLVISENKFILKDSFINKLKQITEIKSIIINFADKNTVNFGKKSKVIFGQDFITEEISGVSFKNFLKSFFQVNPSQTEKLYNKAIELAELKSEDVVIDLYCGVGTISLLCADKVKEVIGIEIVEDAIKSAKENAVNNNINNCKFVLSDAQDLLKYAKNTENLKIIVDPPRKGLDKKVIESIVRLKPKTVVYISCNESTLARDLKIFDEFGFCSNEVTPVDMFCGSHHVENVIKIINTNLA